MELLHLGSPCPVSRFLDDGPAMLFILILKVCNASKYNSLVVCMLLFAESIAALKEVWIIGDTFVREVFPTMQSLKTQAAAAKDTKPYLYEYFNLTPLFPPIGSLVRSR